MTSISHRKFWRDFIEIYKNSPALWEIRADVYRNKPERNRCYNVLLRKLREVDPAADMELLKKKIANLKNVYFRELKKVEASKNTEVEYVPTLWYFDSLSFLKDQRIEKSSRSTDEEDADLEDDKTDEPPRYTSNKGKTGYIKMVCESICKLQGTPKKTEDEADVLGRGWAVSYRKLDEEQRLYAKKAIDDIFILGLRKQLTLDYVQSMTFPPQSYVTIPQYQGTFPNNVIM